MFTLQVANNLKLVLVEPAFAPQYLTIVTREREYLAVWLAWPPHANNEDFFLTFIEQSRTDYKAGKSLTCSIVLNNQVVGNIGFNNISHNLKTVEIGYWLSAQYQGRGIVTKSVAKLIELAFTEMQMHKVQISAAEGNHPSRQIPERLGFQLEGIIRQAENLNGRMVDHAVYGLLRSAWHKP